jgi:hypothetical protein
MAFRTFLKRAERLITASLIAAAVQIAHAQNAKAPVNYETQALAIFQAASGHGGPIGVRLENGAIDREQKEALNRIYAGLIAHKIYLKNVVWRPDLRVIRLTWANDDDSLVFKIVYRVSHDPVLTNSVYADKNEIIDVKIMFLQGGKYRYLHLDSAIRANIRNGQVFYEDSASKKTNGNQKNTPYGSYVLNGHLEASQCKFCHMLVPGVNGRPGGLFFPRYQESGLDGHYSGHSSLEQPTFFDAAEFKKINPKEAPIALPSGLPDTILFNLVKMDDPATKDVYTMYARTMFESPELVEALARDNHESVCISVDFGSAAPLFGKDNYVCADGVRRKLFVKVKNPMLSTGSGKIEYEKPYYVEK